MKMEVQMRGLDGVLKTLQSLPPEIVSRRGGPALAALRKGARVLVTQARENFRRAVAMPGKTGITDTSGFTERQIVSKRRRMPGNINGERIVVTVNPKPHPSGNEYKAKSRAGRGKRLRRNNKGPSARPIQANDIAFIMELGSAAQPATPWLKPAYDTKRGEALQAVEGELVKRVDKIVKKLAAQNKVA